MQKTPVSQDGERPLQVRIRRPARRRRGLPERRGTVVVVALVLGGWLLFVFAGALARADELEGEAAAARRQVELLNDRVHLAEEEITFVTSEAFVEQAARAIGLGKKLELGFRLDEDAPPPAAIPLLGAED